jgi:hypothetical protein
VDKNELSDDGLLTFANKIKKTRSATFKTTKVEICLRLINNNVKNNGLTYIILLVGRAFQNVRVIIKT